MLASVYSGTVGDSNGSHALDSQLMMSDVKDV